MHSSKSFTGHARRRATLRSTVICGLLLLVALAPRVAPAEPAAASAIEARDAWVRATPPGAPVAAGYMSLRNTGAQPRRIVGLRSPLAEQVEIHEMKTVDGQMRMRALPSPTVPARGSLELAPGGTHLMFVGLRQRPVAGQSVPLRLELDDGSSLDLQLPVREAEPEHDAHAHHHP